MTTEYLTQCPDCGCLYENGKEHTCPSTITEPDWRSDALTLLDAASRTVTSERSPVYGRPKVNHQRIAEGWEWWLTKGHTQPIGSVSPADAAMCMLLVKVARLMQTPDHHDSQVDIPGYSMVYHDCVSDR